MYDSLQEGVNLTETIFFKVMTLLGTFLKNADVWIEETRSMQVRPEEKLQILKSLNDPNDKGADVKCLYGYAMEFRGRQSGAADQAFGQLRKDCSMLQKEHQANVCFSFSKQSVESSSELFFRQLYIADKGHLIK
jgi:hypothetical protein